MSSSADCSNFSGETLTVELWDLDDQYRDLTLTIGVVVTIYILLGILLNLAVIGIILKKRLFKQPAVLLLLNLTVTNFLICVLVLPFNAISALAGKFNFGNIVIGSAARFARQAIFSLLCCWYQCTVSLCCLWTGSSMSKGR